MSAPLNSTSSPFRTAIVLFLLLWNGTAFAQVGGLTQYNIERLKTNKTAMTVLGGWAVGNIALGLALQGQRTGSDKYFHQMNAGWNVINLTLAGFGYWSAIKTDPASFDTFATVQEQFKIQKILLFNAGLDVGYMLGGLYLIERSKNDSDNADRLRGFGRSIVLQGAFLFAFDLVTYGFHARHNDSLRPLLGGDQLGLIWNF